MGESDLLPWQKPDLQKAMLRAMLSELLWERCKLVVHREMKRVPMYALVLAKDGPKLKEAVSVDMAELGLKHPSGTALPGGGTLLNQGRQMSFFGTSIATLAEILIHSRREAVER